MSKNMSPREFIIEIMDYMVKTGLTDYTGGNMALRKGEKIYSTPSGASIYSRWKMEPEEIIVTDIDQNVLEGDKDKVSSESGLHHGVLKRFPHINCSIHGNTHYSPLLASRGVRLEGIRDEAKAFRVKEILVVPEDFPMFSDEEKDYIYNGFAENVKKGEALVAVMHNHGTLVAHEDPDMAFVLFNAVEENSKYIYEREVLVTAARVKDIAGRLDHISGILKRLSIRD